MKKSSNNKGITLLEVIVVIAITATLTGIISINFLPFVEKSREATDLANVRNAASDILLAEAHHIHDDSKEETESLHTDTNVYSKNVALTQTKKDWSIDYNSLCIAGVSFGDIEWEGVPDAKGTCTVYTDKGKLHINWNGEGATDYSKVSNVAKYVLSYLQKDLEKYNEGTSADFSDTYKKTNGNGTQTITLPDGRTVNATVYNRDYDDFENVKDRQRIPNTASLIYNRKTGTISTIIYYDGKEYVAWSLSDGLWKENKYK